MFVGLSLDQAPPYNAPIKFFLTAPIFALFSGIFALFSSSFELHNPNVIVAIHLITIGFIIMIVIGALLQMLPVIAGAIIPHSQRVANITYSLLILGLLAFSTGFYLYEKVYFFLASFFLISGLFYFATTALTQLIKVQNKSYIIVGMILSLFFFIFAFFIGIYLIIANATSSISALHYDFALLHYNYIFFGFLFLLIVAITIQVVPMFWVTSAYKKYEQSTILIASTVLLVFYPLNLFLHLELDIVYKILFTIVIFYFVFLTTQKLQNRKRKLKDITVYFYITSMIFLALGAFYWVLMSFISLTQNLFGILMGIGFVVSLMNGMLYKIVPFLTWFHLNAKGLFDIPTMREMIPIQNMQRQFYIHLLSMICFIFGFGFNINIIIKIAIVLFIISNLLLFINIFKAVQIYLKNQHKDPFNINK